MPYGDFRKLKEKELLHRAEMNQIAEQIRVLRKANTYLSQPAAIRDMGKISYR